MIGQNPADIPAALEGTTVAFNAAASAPLLGPVTYRWFRSGIALSDVGRFSGTGTATLTISNVQLADSASAYSVRLAAGSCSVFSQPAGLHVLGRCPADFDRNTLLQVPDIFAFLTAWFAGCS